MNGLSEVTVIKRKVLKEVATLAWQDRLGEIDALPKRLTQEGSPITGVVNTVNGRFWLTGSSWHWGP